MNAEDKKKLISLKFKIYGVMHIKQIYWKLKSIFLNLKVSDIYTNKFVYKNNSGLKFHIKAIIEFLE